jgi:hypothetical protein
VERHLRLGRLWVKVIHGFPTHPLPFLRFTGIWPLAVAAASFLWLPKQTGQATEMVQLPTKAVDLHSSLTQAPPVSLFTGILAQPAVASSSFSPCLQT